MFALISYKTGEVLAYAAMPVRAVCLVKELFDFVADHLFCVCFIDCLVDLLLNVVFHFLVHFANDPFNITLRHYYNFKFINYN